MCLSLLGHAAYPEHALCANERGGEECSGRDAGGDADDLSKRPPNGHPTANVRN